MSRTLNAEHRTIFEWINGTEFIEDKTAKNTSDSNEKKQMLRK